MNILIIGGTLFVGRQYVSAAIEKGHDVTIFHRGKLNTEKVEGVSEVIGDREFDLPRLGSKKWDIVIDTCCYIPRAMRTTLAALKDLTDFYIFVSTIDVYKMSGSFICDENSETLALIEENADDVNRQAKGYGENKRACEILLQDAMPNNHLILRPGKITGPYDVTCRITYWLERFEFGGRVLSTRGPDAPVQWIDVRDLCEWSLGMAENKNVGTYNMVGPKEKFFSGDVFSLCREIINDNVEMVYLPIEFVKTLGETEWHIPPNAFGHAWPHVECYNMVNNAKAIEMGLTFRPAKTTFIDTYEWSKIWGHDYHHRVTGGHSSHGSMEDDMNLEKIILKKYDAWLMAESAL